ncbi:MAG: tripartite tricarboxylate transporter TctB family protein [Burkholderiales bacterium]|nr:tripartite tricarboxylate transporter TctB family protein [Burkholderiales bacterium]
MNDEKHERSAASMRAAEVAVAAFLFLLGALAIWDSVRIGYVWAEDGPQAGYFTFYVGLFICISTGIIIFRALADRAMAARVYVTRGALQQVMQMFVPAVVYVVLISLIGIYVASTLFIGYFMRRLGRYPWVTTIGVAVATSVFVFVLFEVWFSVPLPKGPLEAWLGLD